MLEMHVQLPGVCFLLFAWYSVHGTRQRSETLTSQMTMAQHACDCKLTTLKFVCAASHIWTCKQKRLFVM